MHTLFPAMRCAVPAPPSAWAYILALAVIALPRPVQAEEPEPPARASAEARLEALREALLEHALKVPARVRSSAWVDESGVLRENIHISSEIKVRGIRLLSEWDNPDPASLRLAAQAEASVARSGLRDCAATGPRLKRHAALSSQASPADGRLGDHFLSALASNAEATLHALFLQDKAWVLTAASRSSNTYMRLLDDLDRPQNQPYRLRLRLEAAPPSPLTDLQRVLGVARHTKLMLRVSLQLDDTASGRSLWQESALLEYSEPSPSLRPPELPAALTDAMQRTLRNWLQALRSSLACEPLQFVASTDESEQIFIAAGSRVGLRVGDQLLLIDRTRYPVQLLDADTLRLAALLEVQTVMRDTAIARRIAGPRPAAQHPTLAAVPL